MCEFKCCLEINWQLQGVTLPSQDDIWTPKPKMHYKSSAESD